MSYDFPVLLLRLATGALLFGHGTQTLFGWFGGPDFTATRATFAGHLRLRPATLWTVLAGLSEVGGVLLLATGFLSPLGSLAIIAAILISVLLVHWPRLWLADNGMEYPLVLMAVATAVATANPGAYSLDALLSIAFPAPTSFLIGLSLVLIGVLIALATRAPAPAEAARPADVPPRAA